MKSYYDYCFFIADFTTEVWDQFQEYISESMQ